MAIFNTKNSISEENKFFCLSGSEDFIDSDGFPRVKNEDSDTIVAKVIFSKKPKHFEDSIKSHPRYYIKLDPNSKLFNPKPILSTVKNKDTLDFINNTCKQHWEFKEVTPQIFQKYITFLKTKNLSWLKDAQRDLK